MRLILRFLVKREVTSYLVQIYWPSVLTTVVSWISFWMNYESSAARVTVGKPVPISGKNLAHLAQKKVESKEQCLTAQAREQDGA